jgi:hypothetical protein
MTENNAIKQAIACFTRLRESAAAAERIYSFGGSRVLVRYLDDSLFPLLHPAVAHLECEAANDPDLTIHAFVSTRPPVNFGLAELTESSRRWKSKPFASSDPFCLYVPGRDGRLDLILGERREAFTCFRDANLIPAWDVATPFRDVLHVWHRLNDGHVVHGAIVADEQNAILLAGAGGSGKSSTALACLRYSDLYFLGDDVCLVRRSADVIDSYSLYNSAKLLAHDAPRFGAELPRLDDSQRGDGKPTFFTFPALRHRLALSRPLKAILLVRVHQAKNSELTPASPGDAWKAFGATTLSIVPCDSGAVQWLTDLARDLPIWRLNVGSCREDIPRTIKQVLLPYSPKRPSTRPCAIASFKGAEG